MSDMPPPPEPTPPSSGAFMIPAPTRLSSPEAQAEKKQDNLFVRFSVVIIGVFTAASLLNAIVYAAILFDREWGVLGGCVDLFPIFSKSGTYASLLPYVWSILLQFAWWSFLVFFYICGMYDLVAEKYDVLEWFGIGMPFRFHIFPLGYGWTGMLFLSILFWLVVGVVWIWNLIF